MSWNLCKTEIINCLCSAKAIMDLKKSSEKIKLPTEEDICVKKSSIEKFSFYKSNGEQRFKICLTGNLKIVDRKITNNK